MSGALEDLWGGPGTKGAEGATPGVSPKNNAGHPLARIRNSLRNPVLVGENGYRMRYLRIQWWVVVWRLLILVQIPIVAAVRPDLLGSLRHAFLLLAVAVSYTCFYAWRSTQTRAAGRDWFHVLDVAACASLMFLAQEPKLIFIMSFYSFSALLTRPTTLLRKAAPATVVLSLAYLLASWSAGLSPADFFTSPREVDNFALYYFWGPGFVGFSAVLARVSALELESIISAERKSYRRRLHDDLGNTLCGLHFKIESLRNLGGSDDVKRSLNFLSAGYDRAVSVLRRILSGLDEQTGGDINTALASLKEEFESETGMRMDLLLNAGKIQLSPEVQRQVLGIVREAAANASKHSGADRVAIEARGHGRRLNISVADQGKGFSQADLATRQQKGGLGVKGMYERASMIRGKLEITMNPGGGTRIELTTDIQRPGLIGRVLDYDSENKGSGLYVFLVQLRSAMFIWTVIRLFLLMGDHPFDAPLILVVALLGADSFAFVLFRSQLYRLLSRRPWLLIFEQAMFAVLVYISLQAESFFFFPLYLGVVVIMNGLFFDTLGNIALTLFLNAGIVLAYLLAPAESGPVVRGLRFEEPLQHTTIFIILAFSAGIAGEFIRSLEFLQRQAIDRALTREREILFAETHRQLHDGVFGLGEEIRAMQSAGPAAAGTIEAGAIEHLRSSSSELKKRLRVILASLEDDENEHRGKSWVTSR